MESKGDKMSFKNCITLYEDPEKYNLAIPKI